MKNYILFQIQTSITQYCSFLSYHQQATKFDISNSIYQVEITKQSLTHLRVFYQYDCKEQYTTCNIFSCSCEIVLD